MKHSIKNITVNGINYYLVGNCYMPTAPGLVPDRRTGIYGMIHLKYLQMAHPDDVVEHIASGRIRQYYVSELTLTFGALRRLAGNREENVQTIP